MKVVLLHEYSGVHTELKKGLVELGVDAKTANFGDLQRGFPSDLNIGTGDHGLSNSIIRAARQLGVLRELEQANVIQSIAATPFNPLVSWLLESVLLHRQRSRFVYLAAGSDAIYRKHARSLPYWPPHDWYENPARYQTEMRIIKRAQRIVAGAWDYSEVYRREGMLTEFIPFPVMVRDIEYREIGRRPRLRVYHPLNRGAGNDFKGTSHILDAFEKLRRRFGNDVEFLSVGNMPFREYIEFVRDVDVVVDQANSLSYGMSAVYGMAQGKVVLSGAEDVTHEFDVYRDSPVINIKPQADDIADKIEMLLADRSALIDRGSASRSFVEKYHDAVVVAASYVRLYGTLS